MSIWESQTFNLRGPRDVLAKLQWEVDELAETRAVDIHLIAYRSINCAMTAWHMCDWLFAECERTPSVREAPTNIAHRKISSLGDMQAWAREERSIAICRQIATAAKHVEVTQHPDPAVKAQYEVGGKGMPVRDEDGWPKLVICDGQETHRPHHVFVDALRFWRLALGWLDIK